MPIKWIFETLGGMLMWISVKDQSIIILELFGFESSGFNSHPRGMMLRQNQHI